MSLSVGREGAIRFAGAQARYEPRPWTLCNFYARATLLAWMGLGIPEREVRGFAAKLARASGTKPDSATNAADGNRAFEALLPWVEVESKTMEEADFIAGLGSEYAAVVLVTLRSGVRHFVTYVDARDKDGVTQLRRIDPLSKDRWVSRAFFRKEAKVSYYGSKVFATFGLRGDAVSTLIRDVQTFAPSPATVDMPAGKLNTFVVDDAALSVKQGREVTFPHSVATLHTDRIVNVTNRPAGSKPTGSFVRLVDGPAAGRYVRSGSVVVNPPVSTAPPDAAAIEAAARADERRIVEGEYQPVAEPVYQREVAA